MGRPPSITIGNETDGVRVEHVKSRGLVRLVRWVAGTAQDDALGMEVTDFCSRLGITTDVLSGARRYLLVAHPARPGARHVVAVFNDEDEARDEFVRFRRTEKSPGAWAEVVDISPGRPTRPVCWFGAADASPGLQPEAVRVNGSGPRRARFGRRTRHGVQPRF